MQVATHSTGCQGWLLGVLLPDVALEAMSSADQALMGFSRFPFNPTLSMAASCGSRQQLLRLHGGAATH
eukprot:8505801-Alexandrium_andersonii.AAC.1